MDEDNLTLTGKDLEEAQPATTVLGDSTARTNEEFVEGLDPVIQAGADGIVRAETEEAAKRDDLLNNILGSEVNSAQDIYQDTFNSQAKTLGYDGGEALTSQLRDANTVLAQLQGKFRTETAKIEDLAGTKGAKAGVLGEISRQEAVEVGNQALLVQALQGNYDTARQIALDTASFASEDRAAQLQNWIAQYEAVQGIVSGQEQQLLDQQAEQKKAELAELERTQAMIDTAITSGGASFEELQKLTSADLSDKEKQAVAQRIISRVSGEERDIDLATKRADLAYKGEQLNQIRLQNKELEEAATPEDNTETVKARTASKLATIEALINSDGLNSSVGGNPLARMQLTDALTGEADDFVSGVEQIISGLSLDELQEAKAKGATFGALSNAEWEILAASATAIGGRRVRAKAGDGEELGRVTGYDMSEDNMVKQLRVISDFAKLDALERGIPAAELGIELEEDGTFAIPLADGSVYITEKTYK